MYLIVFSLVLSFLLSALLCVPLYRYLALRWGILDRPSDVKTHDNVVPYMGGIAIFTSIFLSIFSVFFLEKQMDWLPIIWLCGISLLVVLFGLWDDMYDLSYQKKFLFQAIITSPLLYFLLPSSLFFSPLFFILCVLIVYIINSFNLIDVIDGMSVSTSVIISCFFLILSLFFQDIFLQILCSSIIGTGIGFLLYNFSKTRKIFLGDSGSLFLGVVFSYIGIKIGLLIFAHASISNIHIIIPIFFLVIPIGNTIGSIIFRILRRENPFLHSMIKPDHLPTIVNNYFFSAWRSVCFIGILHVLYSIVVLYNFFLIPNYYYNILMYILLCFIVIGCIVCLYKFNRYRKKDK